MKIQWLGHACFLITNQGGHALLTDPFDGSLGYPVPTARADIVTISHHHFDHDYLAQLQPGYMAIDSAARFDGFGFTVYGVECFHDDAKGAKRGGNIIFVIEADGLRVAHFGDIGHIPTDEQVEQIGHVDVMLIPVGGYYTIDAAQAVRVRDVIKPRVTVPMHYRNGYWDDENIQGVDAFLSIAGCPYERRDALELPLDGIGVMAGIAVLERR